MSPHLCDGRTHRRTEITTITVAAAIRDGIAVLLDRDGRALGKRIRLERFGEISAEARTAWEWHYAVRNMAQALASRTAARMADPWARRMNNLVASFRLRRFDRPLRGGRAFFDSYATHTWSEAAKRLVMQGHNRFRVRTRSGWERWAYTVSNNQQKRADGYAQR